MRHVEKNVFVTGAGRGFGRATALAFAREGAAVVHLVDRLRDELSSTAREVEALGARPVEIHADLSTFAGCDDAVKAALHAGGQIDHAVINHAYIAPKTAFLELEDYAWSGNADAQGFLRRMSQTVDSRGGIAAMADADDFEDKRNSAFLGSLSLSGSAVDAQKLDSYVRECMFGGAFGPFGTTGCHFFDESHPAYVRIAALARLRNRSDHVGHCLRRGDLYVREVRYDKDFIAPAQGHIVAWSRVAENASVVVAINTHGNEPRVRTGEP